MKMKGWELIEQLTEALRAEGRGRGSPVSSTTTLRTIGASTYRARSPLRTW